MLNEIIQYKKNNTSIIKTHLFYCAIHTGCSSIPEFFLYFFFFLGQLNLGLELTIIFSIDLFF